MKTSVPGKSTDTAFTAVFECMFVINMIKILKDDAAVKSLDFIYKEFPVFGEISAFLGKDAEILETHIHYDDVGVPIFRHADIAHKITLVN